MAKGVNLKDLKRFATADFPLHPSMLRDLMECPWRLTSMFLYEPSGEGGVAGDTGSAVHAAAHAMHSGKEVADCLGVMKQKLAQYPKADLLDAANLFLRYSQDSRNKEAKVILNERQVDFSIAPSKEDETGEPIVFTGRLDQVRDVDGRLKVYDIKSTKFDPGQMQSEYMFQMAAYCVGASTLLKQRVDPGACIYVRKYTDKNHSQAPVFWHYAWTFEDCEQILDVFRHRVAEIRRGIIYHNPIESKCRWCHLRSPDMCLPKLKQELRDRNPVQ